MPTFCEKLLSFALLLVLLLPSFAYSQTGTSVITIGTHAAGSAGTYFNAGFTEPSSPILLKQISLSNGVLSSLNQIDNYSSMNGDLIELGFFDTSDTSTIAPNNSSNSNTNLFVGQWTALTSKLRIGYDELTTTAPFDDGNFSFKITFNNSGTGALGNAGDGNATINVRPDPDPQAGSARDPLVDTLDSFSASDFSNTVTNDLNDRVEALASTSGSYIGIRFYDQTDPRDQVTRYNTIMNTSWTFPSLGSDTQLLLHSSDGSQTSGLQFEFDNTGARSAGYSMIGTGSGGYSLPDDDFVATITYFDGTSLDLDNTGGIGDTILSGLNSGGTINVGDDNNILTINSTSGNSFTYTGKIEEDSGAGNASIVKTGDGGQILTGAINLAGSNTGFINIWEGNLTLAPSTASSQLVEYITGGSSSAVLELNNTGVHFRSTYSTRVCEFKCR